jgi:flagellin-specific chaperone FliS
LKRDPAMLKKVIEVLLPLRSAWNVASTTRGPGTAPANETERAQAEG